MSQCHKTRLHEAGSGRNVKIIFCVTIIKTSQGHHFPLTLCSFLAYCTSHFARCVQASLISHQVNKYIRIRRWKRVFFITHTLSWHSKLSVHYSAVVTYTKIFLHRKGWFPFSYTQPHHSKMDHLER